MQQKETSGIIWVFPPKNVHKVTHLRNGEALGVHQGEEFPEFPCAGQISHDSPEGICVFVVSHSHADGSVRGHHVQRVG